MTGLGTKYGRRNFSLRVRVIYTSVGDRKVSVVSEIMTCCAARRSE
jgi:hypothetical protein